jgi:hypothetical protein
MKQATCVKLIFIKSTIVFLNAHNITAIALGSGAFRNRQYHCCRKKPAHHATNSIHTTATVGTQHRHAGA